MTPEQGALTLAGRMMKGAGEQELLARVETARQTVGARESGIDQDDLLEDAPPELAPFVQRLRAQQNAVALFSEGWEVRIADLSRVCSLQQLVHSEQTTERVAAVDPGDVLPARVDTSGRLFL